MPARKTRLITAEDLYRFELITDCRISPDGQHVVYAVQRVDKKTEKKYANLWIVPSRSGRPQPFTSGDQLDSSPRWSPDGTRIAFISKRGDASQPQLYVIPFQGGEARQLTRMQGDFGAFEWSPDGSRIVCQFRKKDAEAIQRETDDRTKDLGVVAYHITRVRFKNNGEGILPRERWHLWIVDAKNGKARQITRGEVPDELSPCWSPDGRSIAFVSNRSADPDLNPYADDLFVVSASTGRVRQIKTPFGPKSLPSYSPDGKWIAYVGFEGRGDWWKNDSLWIVPASGGGPARNLTGRHDVHVSCWTSNDVLKPPLVPAVWSADGGSLYFQVDHHGNTELRAISLDGKRLDSIVGGPGVVGAFSFDDRQSRLAFFYAHMADPGQVCVRDMASGRTRTLTAVNRRLLNSIDLGEIEEVWFKGGAGNRLQGWILKPPGFNPRETYPSILQIHGGPLIQYGHFFMHEFYYLAAQGYVVAFCNPRGGRGYGEAHAKAIWNAWGTVDYDDVMAWADVVARRRYVDRKRMGVTGGSYGGYLTNWIIGHTRRFKAAVTQRSLSNFISMWGSSDGNWGSQEVVGDLPPWENVEAFWDRSPMKYIGNARTPTLVVHSEQDLRCNIEQGEQVYVALKVLGVDTEMVRFPAESHELSRSGRTDRRVARLNAIMGWFDRYLK